MRDHSGSCMISALTDPIFGKVWIGLDGIGELTRIPAVIGLAKPVTVAGGVVEAAIAWIWLAIAQQIREAKKTMETIHMGTKRHRKSRNWRPRGAYRRTPLLGKSMARKEYPLDTARGRSENLSYRLEFEPVILYE